MVTTSPAGTNGWGLDAVLAAAEVAPADASISGNRRAVVTGLAAIGDANVGDLAFCWWEPDRAVQAVQSTAATVVFCKPEVAAAVQPRTEKAVVALANPRLAFIRFARKWQLAAAAASESPRIAVTARVASSAQLAPDCRVGEYSVVGENCVIGPRTVLHDRVVLRPNTRIGADCVIQSGVTLGEDGFAYERNDDGSLEKFPHVKGVVLGDGVEISANCSVARGSLTDTSIGSGTKLDALVHVAHNVQIGRNCMLTAGTIIGGSTTLGDSCWTGLNSTIRDRIAIGSNVIIAAGACVLKPVPDGDVVAGVPAKSIKERVTTSETFLMAGQDQKDKPAE